MKFTIGSKIGFVLATLSALQIAPSIAFTQPSLSSRRHEYGNSHSIHKPVSSNIQNAPLGTSTSLNVWWFGGNDSEQDDESCELVAVRIERTSANSRRIAGDIVIPRPIEDVWAILTDYDNLSTHVPNLVESKRVNPGRNAKSTGVQGDGSYTCRLFQRGAQKIIGFEFGASVTMDMTEQILQARNNNIHSSINVNELVLPESSSNHQQTQDINVNEQKRILFKCVESQFFSEFDGEWKVSWVTDPDDPSQLATKIEYTVDVRPNGPVPVQALEWRIREDVPTNLRAVKAASMELGQGGVLALRDSQRSRRNGNVQSSTSNSRPRVNTTSETRRRGPIGRLSNVGSSTNGSNRFRSSSRRNNGAATATMAQQRQTRLAPVKVNWKMEGNKDTPNKIRTSFEIMKVVIPFLLTFLSVVSSSPELVCREKCKSIDVEARCRKSNYTHKSNLKSCLKGANTSRKLFCTKYCQGEKISLLNSHQECTNARISKRNIEEFSYCRLGFDRAVVLLQEEMKEITVTLESESDNSVVESKPEPAHYDNTKTDQDEIPTVDDLILKVEEIITQSDPVETVEVATEESFEDNNEVVEEDSNPIEASLETQVIEANIIDTNEYSNISSIEINAVSFENEKHFLK